MVIGLLKRHSDVWVACIDTLSQYMDNTSFSSNGIGMILREGKPSGTERMLWQLIFPKVLVYPKNILIFHVVDGNEIRYQMRRTIVGDDHAAVDQGFAGGRNDRKTVDGLLDFHIVILRVLDAGAETTRQQIQGGVVAFRICAVDFHRCGQLPLSGHGIKIQDFLRTLVESHGVRIEGHAGKVIAALDFQTFLRGNSGAVI